MKPMLFLEPIPMQRELADGPSDPIIQADVTRPALSDLREATPKIAATPRFDLKLRRI